MGKPKQYAEHEAATLIPQTPNQESLMEAIKESEQVVVLGPAGTGKSFITAGMAADWYKQNSKRKIIITRPIVPVGEDLGHLPGTLEEKVTPWAAPVLQIIQQRIGRGKLECDLHKSIEIIPLQLMRGHTFDDAWVLVDEAQNLTIDQAKMLVTRIGVNAKLLINGDINQKDIHESSGLSWLVNNINRHKMPIPVVNFNINDCQRSGICRMWLEVMEKDSSSTPVWETVKRVG